MDTTDLIYLIAAIGAILTPTITIFIFFSGILQRLAKVEECINPEDAKAIAKLDTKMDFVLRWIAALNGEMRNDKDFEDFLKELKKVAKGKGL